MYHPSRGGVRGGRDQFNWDDVKTDKHRENYLGHSVKAPVGRWQKGKDLTWYARDKKSALNADEETKAEIQRIKEEEEQAMREVLGLAPKRGKQFQGNRLDKHETAELLKRGKTEEDLLPDYAQGERIQGLGFAPAPRHYSNKAAHLPQSNSSEMTQKQVVKHSMDDQPKEEEDDHVDTKMRRKLEKREAKEKRKEEKREAKKEKRKHSVTTSDVDKRHRDGKRSRRKHDSSESSG